MSISIKNMAVHQLSLNEAEEVTLELRSEPLQASGLEEALITQLHSLMNNTKSKTYGLYESNSEMKEILSSKRDTSDEFHKVSVSAAQNFHSNLVRYPFAEAGFLVICEYETLATHYLTVALIPRDTTLKIEENLELSTTQHIDLSKVQLLSRIDLTGLLVNEDSNRYITIKNGRATQKFKDFGLDFWGASVGLDTKNQNIVLMQAVNDFCADSKMENAEANEHRRAVQNYAKEVDSCNSEITIKELSGELPSSSEGLSFLDYTKEQGYELEDSFPAQPTALRELSKFIGAGGGVNISFDCILLDERVFYCPETDSLTFKGLPPNLRDSLKRRRGVVTEK